MLTVLKLGGELLEDAGAMATAAASVARLASAGPIAVVHGGGRAIDADLRARGVSPRFADGLRITDADTLAADLAARLGAGRLVIAGVTAGVRDQNGRTIPALDLEGADALVASGVASAGMVAKLIACRDALDAGVGEVLLVDGREPATLQSVLDGSAAELPGTRMVAVLEANTRGAGAGWRDIRPADRVGRARVDRRGHRDRRHDRQAQRVCERARTRRRGNPHRLGAKRRLRHRGRHEARRRTRDDSWAHEFTDSLIH
ncbi:MAG: hypothetical protein DMF85_00475 [Acidobacteria bacterium]|nr:MAG: hypothetical protein DMF85_00475 [Acidobacteriota bacterium]